MNEQPGESGPSRPGPDQPEGPAPGVRVRLRRAPRFGAFTLSGALLGLLVGGAVAVLGPDQTQTDFSPATAAGYLGAIGLVLGAVIGAAVAVLLDRRR